MDRRRLQPHDRDRRRRARRTACAGLADADYYRLTDDGAYVETSGCGNDIDTASPVAQDLVVAALDRFADLGVDGFRFDLAPVLSRDTGRSSPDSTSGRRGVGVRMVAEPWDAVGTYQLGRAWPGRGWLQWNDRFRDDVRGFLRSEGGLVPALMQRVAGQSRRVRRPDCRASTS